MLYVLVVNKDSIYLTTGTECVHLEPDIINEVLREESKRHVVGRH